MANRRNYKIRCLNDDKVYDSIQDVCNAYSMTYDQVAYRIDHVKDYKDGMNFVRVIDNSEALKTVEAVDSSAFVDKFGDKTVPLPGYEDKYTISTKGVVTNVKQYGRVLPVKTEVTIKHKVILHKTVDGKQQSQVHSLTNLMKAAFGDPDRVDSSDPDKAE